MFFLRYLRRELGRRYRQSLVVAVGLALGIGLVMTVTALSSGVSAAQGKVLKSLYGVGTDMTVTVPFNPASTGGIHGTISPGPTAQYNDVLQSLTVGTFSASRVSQIARLRGVARVTAGLVLTDSKSTIPGEDSPPPSSFQPPTLISVVGIALTRTVLGPYDDGRIVAGRSFSTDQADKNVAVVDETYAATDHLRVGSQVVLSETSFVVIGLIDQPADSNPPNVYIPLGRAQTLAQLSGQVNSLYVEATSTTKVSGVASDISRLMPSATVTDSSSLAKEITGSLATTSSLAKRLGTWLAILVLIMAFAVASLLTLAAIARRTRELGTLKALGWRDRRVVGQVIGELFVLGVVGAGIGIGIGATGAFAASSAASHLSATVQETNDSNTAGGFGGGLGAGGSFFSGQVGGPVTTISNPNATHTVVIPFNAPITSGVVVLAIVLALAGALMAGSLGGWRAARLRPAAAFARVE
jgi:putative ABC transport system permease protein